MTRRVRAFSLYQYVSALRRQLRFHPRWLEEAMGTERTPADRSGAIANAPSAVDQTVHFLYFIIPALLAALLAAFLASLFVALFAALLAALPAALPAALLAVLLAALPKNLASRADEQPRNNACALCYFPDEQRPDSARLISRASQLGAFLVYAAFQLSGRIRAGGPCDLCRGAHRSLSSCAPLAELALRLASACTA